MGKATIQSGGLDGKYNILYKISKIRMEAKITKLAENITIAESVELPVLEASLASVEATILDLQIQLNAAISDKNMDEIRKLTSYINTSRMQRDSEKSEVSGKKIEITSLKAEKTYLENNLPEDIVMERVWCADFNEEIVGDVGTIEVPGERLAPIIIKPGGNFGVAAANTPVTDGQITPVLGLSTAECFYNEAMMPGWQKWKSKYRLATITAIDNDRDTCEIVLDPAFSSQKDESGIAFNVNQSSIYEDVPIIYMRCNSYAFGVGNKVVVEFDGITPTVIGFESNPQECKWKRIMYFEPSFPTCRPYNLIDELWPERETSMKDPFVTPYQIIKIYKGVTYTLYTNPAAPKLVIQKPSEPLVEYLLAPIEELPPNGQEYDVKRLEVKSDVIYIHDYKYVKLISGGKYQQLSGGAKARIMSYDLDMVLINTVNITWPYGFAFLDAYWSSEKIYVVPGPELVGGGWSTIYEVIEFNHDWAYQKTTTINFKGVLITGWAKEKVIVCGYDMPDIYNNNVRLYWVAGFDANMNPLWSTSLGGKELLSVSSNGQHVIIGVLGDANVGGKIYLLDISTGYIVGTYTLPVENNIFTGYHMGEYPTVYSPAKLDMYKNKLYVGASLQHPYAGRTYDRVFIFDITAGIVLVKQGFPLFMKPLPLEGTVSGYEGPLDGYYYYYHSEMGVKGLSASKWGWWLSMDKKIIEQNGQVDEMGGTYIFDAGAEEITHIGWINPFADSDYGVLGTKIF